ncbi:unnamed protein product [Pleuronectes platessa]|uniref:Uncharacterized protein n=1 Tax=Pleuronectes platessa TaxID=8262 RepID=A0A9N7YAX3_PLEPL|nr:unnamed protein product [Pleuronectes platessa]
MQPLNRLLLPAPLPGAGSVPGRILGPEMRTVRSFSSSSVSSVSGVCLQPQLVLARRAKLPSADPLNGCASSRGQRDGASVKAPPPRVLRGSTGSSTLSKSH